MSDHLARDSVGLANLPPPPVASLKRNNRELGQRNNDGPMDGTVSTLKTCSHTRNLLCEEMAANCNGDEFGDNSIAT